MKPLFTFATVLTFAVAANAASVSFQGNFSIPLSPGNQAVNLQQFDPSLGTLTNVLIEIDGAITANVTAENDSAQSGNITLSITGNAAGTAPSGINAVGIVNQVEGPVFVDAAEAPDGGGADFHDFGLLNAPYSGNDSINSGFAPYIGLSTFAVNVDASGGFAISGVTDSTLQISNFQTDGIAKVTYTFTDGTTIPTPAAAGSMLAIAGLGLFRRRR